MTTRSSWSTWAYATGQVPGQVPGQGLRIGDAERDAAVGALGEHFAAGRISKDEYDERAGAAWAARTQADLGPLFGDLPLPHGTVADRHAAHSSRSGSGSRRPFPARVPSLPLLVAIAVLAVILHAPWLLLGLVFWLWFGRSMAYWRRS
jgi:hypothetical protein